MFSPRCRKSPRGPGDCRRAMSVTRHRSRPIVRLCVRSPHCRSRLTGADGACPARHPCRHRRQAVGGRRWGSGQLRRRMIRRGFANLLVLPRYRAPPARRSAWRSPTAVSLRSRHGPTSSPAPRPFPQRMPELSRPLRGRYPLPLRQRNWCRCRPARARICRRCSYRTIRGSRLPGALWSPRSPRRSPLMARNSPNCWTRWATAQTGHCRSRRVCSRPAAHPCPGRPCPLSKQAHPADRLSGSNR